MIVWKKVQTNSVLLRGEDAHTARCQGSVRLYDRPDMEKRYKVVAEVHCVGLRVWLYEQTYRSIARAHRSYSDARLRATDRMKRLSHLH